MVKLVESDAIVIDAIPGLEIATYLSRKKNSGLHEFGALITEIAGTVDNRSNVKEGTGSIFT